jgi:hypothetical protein
LFVLFSFPDTPPSVNQFHAAPEPFPQSLKHLLTNLVLLKLN